MTKEQIDLISSEFYNQMKADLEQRTGIKINRFEVGKVDFLRDIALVQIYYFTDDQNLTNFGQSNRYE